MVLLPYHVVAESVKRMEDRSGGKFGEALARSRAVAARKALAVRSRSTGLTPAEEAL
jgi:hypothetical protein